MPVKKALLILMRKPCSVSSLETLLGSCSAVICSPATLQPACILSSYPCSPALSLVLSWLSFGLALPSAAQPQLPPQLQYLKAKIQRNVLHTPASDKITYLAKPYPAAALTIQSYPTYVYYEPAGVAGQFEFLPDTTAGYAALYRVIARANWS